MATYMLTTKDNPYNPFEQWDEWYSYDERMGYHTCSYLAKKLAINEIIEDEELRAVADEKAIDEIIEFDLYGNYEKVENPGKNAKRGTSSASETKNSNKIE